MLKYASLVAQTGKNLPAMWETPIRSLDWEDPLEKGKVAHSSIPAWTIPWTEEPGRLQFMGSQSRTQLSMHTQACCGYLEPQEKHITSTGSILFTS